MQLWSMKNEIRNYCFSSKMFHKDETDNCPLSVILKHMHVSQTYFISLCFRIKLMISGKKQEESSNVYYDKSSVIKLLD